MTSHKTEPLNPEIIYLVDPDCPMPLVLDGGAGTGIQGSETIGLGVTRDLINDGVISLVGKRVGTMRSLAVIAQVLRHTGYETFSTIYVKDGKVVHHEALSSKLPGIVVISESNAELTKIMINIHRNIDRLNADGYYFVHNHPSGDPTPSGADIQLTSKFANAQAAGVHKNNVADMFRGHVIINSGKYAVINKTGTRRNEGNHKIL